MMRILLFLATNLAVLFIFNIILSLTGIRSQDAMGLLILAALFGFVGSFISLWFSRGIALRAVNGEVITQPRNQMEDWLMQTISYLAQKDGLPMPEVAIYASPDMNAFATGPSKSKSLIAVSTALMEGMTPEEVQAVLAHEMSHIKNGDMVTMALLQGVVNTFVTFLSRLIANAVATTRSDEEDNGELSYGIYFIVSMILELVFGVLASIIVMWFSRFREYRADAGAAQLVGKQKMIDALRRLEQVSDPHEMEGSLAAFGINGKRGNIMDLFLSHPPLEKRIEALQKMQ